MIIKMISHALYMIQELLIMVISKSKSRKDYISELGKGRVAVDYVLKE